MKNISAWMAKDVRTIDKAQSVYEAALNLAEHKIGCLVVVSDNKPVGIVTERDILMKVVAEAKDPKETRIEHIMSSEIKVADISSSYSKVYEMMRLYHIRHLPIVENGALVGMVSIRDLVRFNVRVMEQKIDSLTEELKWVKGLLDKSLDEKTKELLIEKERLQSLVSTDSLTGLYNYKYFEEILSKEVSRARRYNRRFSLLFIDVDNFKHYNDTNGHDKGNLALKQIANLLTTTSRYADGVFKTKNIDIIARYGGEEFIIILPETLKKGGIIRANKIIKDIRNYPFFNKEAQPGGNLTISIGVAECPDDAETSEDLIRKADEALYKAKSAGKDRVAS